MSTITDFIARWKASGGSEQANSQLFLAELCDVLNLPHPEPAKPVNEENVYSFERKVFVPKGNGQNELKRLDLYRKGCFILESKQGQENTASVAVSGQTASRAVRRGTRQWEDTMLRAKRQAENYVRCLPADEGRPPFLIIADVGFCFDLYTEFSRTGGVYLHFPDARTHRIKLEELEKPEVQELFRAIWNDPLSLDPARRSARVTEEVASHLAALARSLERYGHSPEDVSQFLMRCIFTMFAEDVSLIPSGSFANILQKAVVNPILYESLLRDLWTAMNAGSVSVALEKKLLRFNGKIFADPTILPLSKQEVGILLEAAKADWKEVEPAIFGTLLERALDPLERHKLGAHYTPRAYVERLVLPTVMEPLRQEWDDVQAAASLLHSQGKEQEAAKIVRAFHDRLLKVRVLDPACGSGNFLYVTMEHMKRLESEVLQACASYGDRSLTLLQVDPHQFLGLEVNPRAAHIAEMVLWIGFLQWHFRTHGNVAPAEPVIKRFENIKNRDALMDWTDIHDVTNADGNPITHWDGHTYKEDSVTGRSVPNELAVVAEKAYVGVTVAEWPEADFIVGNPPFVGGGVKRSALGHGYFKALGEAYPELPESCDFVMYWWHKAASLVRSGHARRFGFISTNTITQIFNRRITASHLDADTPFQLAFAIPDHPWVDASDGAAVRIAMTVGANLKAAGQLFTVLTEQTTDSRECHVEFVERRGDINADLTIGVDVTKAVPLRSNEKICSPGVKLHGSGFIVTPDEASELGLGTIAGVEQHIRPYRNGRDLTGKCRNVMVIDLFGLTANEVLALYPSVYQWVYERVKPERDVNNRACYRDNWWIFGEPRKDLRPALVGLSRFISTVETAKHRVFVFLDASILPDNMLVNIATEDAFHLGVLSSRFHVCWALAAGGRLGIGNDPRYNKKVCFDKFPFPETNEEKKQCIRTIAESLDAHRKQRKSLHPELTLTDMYNVLEALKEGRSLTEKERAINDKGLITVLRTLHDQLDAAVADAYGWPVELTEQEILDRVVKLNAARAREEEQGVIRWLRSEYQTRLVNNVTVSPSDEETDVEVEEKPRKASSTAKKEPKLPWPATLLEQTKAIREVMVSMQETGTGATHDAVAARFSRAPRAKVLEIWQVLESLGVVG